MKRILVAALALVVALAVAACGNDSSEESSGRLTVRFIQPIPESIAFYPYILAQRLGYFEAEGLDVELRPSGQTEQTLQLAANNVDIAAINPPEILSSLKQGQDWVAFYDFYQKNVFSIKTPSDSGIQSVADLEGKVLGITSEGGGELPLVKAALGESGLEADKDVELLVVGDGGPQSARALESGTIDAYAAAIQDFVGIEVSGTELRDITPAKFVTLPSSSLVMQRKLYESDEGRKMALGFARAWAKATAVGAMDKDFIYEVGKEAVPEETEDESFGRPFLDTVLELTAVQPDQNNKYGQPSPARWKISEALLREVGELDEEIPPSSFLDDGVIADANDFDRDALKADIEKYRSSN